MAVPATTSAPRDSAAHLGNGLIYMSLSGGLVPAWVGGAGRRPATIRPDAELVRQKKRQRYGHPMLEVPLEISLHNIERSPSSEVELCDREYEIDRMSDRL